MFIFWGTKRVVKKLGYAADFCHICRSITPFKISRIGMASHLYFISFGQGELVGFTGICQQCGVLKSVEGSNYAAFEKKIGAPIEVLIQTTFPNIKQSYSTRLAQEEEIKKGRLKISAEERVTWLLEPFKFLECFTKNDETNPRKADGRDARVLYSFVGTLVLFILPLWLGTFFQKEVTVKNLLFIASFLFLFTGIIFTLVQMVLAHKNFFRKRVYGNLVKALLPLKPSREELESCLRTLRTLGYKIGKKVKLEKLWQLMQEASRTKML